MKKLVGVLVAILVLAASNLAYAQCCNGQSCKVAPAAAKVGVDTCCVAVAKTCRVAKAAVVDTCCAVGRMVKAPVRVAKVASRAVATPVRAVGHCFHRCRCR